MRVVTTCAKKDTETIGQRWLDGRKFWPEGTEFVFYTEGLATNHPAACCKPILDIPEFAAWKLRHAHYIPPSWPWDVVKFANKVFAAYDALYDYGGIGVWLDADCITYKHLEGGPDGTILRALNGANFGCYQRTGNYTETGLWIVDGDWADRRAFFDYWRDIYLTDRFKKLPQWTDCFTLDATIAKFKRDNKIRVCNLSGEFAKEAHPQARSELGKYIDHCKGPRKVAGISPENKWRTAA